MAMQTVNGRRAALGVGAMLHLSLAAPAIAEDVAPAKTDVAIPSVEELAIARARAREKPTPARRCA